MMIITDFNATRLDALMTRRQVLFPRFIIYILLYYYISNFLKIIWRSHVYHKNPELLYQYTIIIATVSNISKWHNLKNK